MAAVMMAGCPGPIPGRYRMPDYRIGHVAQTDTHLALTFAAVEATI
ncbi:hypothetical protein [Achromobacter sp. UMC71]|nr:hypothetical protein [Achromobacter sp. UMC71]